MRKRLCCGRFTSAASWALLSDVRITVEAGAAAGKQLVKTEQTQMNITRQNLKTK